MPTTDLLIGSFPSLPASTLSVNAGGVEVLNFAADSYYLFNSDDGFDLLAQLADALNSHSNLSGVTVFIQENLRVRIQGGATAFTVQWPANGILRDLLGFTGNLASATSHTAPNISPLLWSAGRPATYLARLGTDGIPVYDTAIGQSAPGIVRATSHNSYRKNTLSFRYVQNSRVWTTVEAGGEFFAFFHEVLRQVRRFKVWRNVVEDLSSTDELTFPSTPLPSTGAYVYAPPSRPVEMPWGREFAAKESLHPIVLPVVQSPEY